MRLRYTRKIKTNNGSLIDLHTKLRTKRIIVLFLLFNVLLISVYEKEREWGHDPYAPEDTPFGEYTRKYVYTNYLQVGFYN